MMKTNQSLLYGVAMIAIQLLTSLASQAQGNADGYFEGTISYRNLSYEAGVPDSAESRKETYQQVFADGDMLRRTIYHGELPAIITYNNIIPGEYLLLGDSAQYEVCHSEKAFRRIEKSPLPYEDYGYFAENARTVEPTSDSMILQGYTCRKYIIKGVDQVFNRGDSVAYHYWLAPELRIENYMQKARYFRKATFLPVEINAGFPLRVDCLRADEEGEMILRRSFWVISVEPGQVEPIAVPEEYREGPWDGRGE